jgi:glutamyl/glutaminyl-tRNA synthetase
VSKRTKTVSLLIILLCSGAFLIFFVANFASSSSSRAPEKSNAQSLDDLATQYANTSTPLNQVLQDLDSLAQNQTLTAEETDWLKTRISELRGAGSSSETLAQPETLEAYATYFADYDSQTLSEIKTAQNLYDQYTHNPGPDAPITQATLHVLDQVRLRETYNLIFINSEINQLVVNGTLTCEQGVLLRERVQQLRTS